MPNYPLSITLLDAYGRTTKRSFLVPGANFAAAQAIVSAVVPDYQAVTELAIIETRLTDKVTYVDSPTSGANRDEGMTMSCMLETPGKKASVQVPGPIEAARLPDGTIDLTDTDIAAFILNFTGGSLLVSDGEVVDQVLSAVLDK